MRPRDCATTLVLAALVASPAVSGGAPFTTGSNVPDCGGGSKKLWRISVKGLDPSTQTSQHRQFELE